MIIELAVKYQASCWASQANLYVPLYRQAHIRSFEDKFYEKYGKKALEFAYKDIKFSFQYYLSKLHMVFSFQALALDQNLHHPFLHQGSL